MLGEDKLVQDAVREVLEAVYEQDFLSCSHGFRPGNGPGLLYSGMHSEPFCDRKVEMSDFLQSRDVRSGLAG
jgi:hypothetical protein